MSQNTRIRNASIDDAELILDFIVGLARYEKLEHEVVGSVDDIQSSLFGTDPAAEVLIAEHDGKPAGFALFFSSYSTFLARAGIYLEDLFVYPQFRGHGVGKSLLAHLASLAVDRKMGRLDWSVLNWNEPAIRFYQQIGAKGMTQWTQYRLSGDPLIELANSTNT